MSFQLSCDNPDSGDRHGTIRLLQDEPTFSDLLSHNNIPLEEEPLDKLFNSTEKRLARMLFLLADFGKEGQPDPVIPKISQETLAEIIGTTRSRVDFFMTKFRKLGLIDSCPPNREADRITT
jgi:CRP/FNR family cyclic AMP-dependent transcriptional regulator